MKFLSSTLDEFVMCSLHDVHEMNAYRLATSVCLSVHMIQPENHWTDSEEIWYELYAIGDYPKIILFKFIHSVIPKWQTNKLVR
jgi:hypothetical protein